MKVIQNKSWHVALACMLLLSFLPIEMSAQNDYSWMKLETEPFRGKQDDIYFLNSDLGWYINGSGALYKTVNGGATWKLLYEKPGSFFRTVLFLSEKVGFIGTVGVGYFPNVQDSIPLYRTTDGGNTWHPVEYQGPYVNGLCGLDVVHETFINHGMTDTLIHIYAVGRVGGPARFMVSHDSGKTWSSTDLSDQCGMLFDIKMLDKNKGFACASTSDQLVNSHASILKTADGGKSWTQVYVSSRSYETTWKIDLPSPLVAFATVQNYNPQREESTQRVIKSTDGGESWTELPFAEDAQARPFGVGFINEQIGYVGTMTQGYETLNGGESWRPIELGRATNKIRIHRGPHGFYGYAIGVNIFKLMHENNVK